MSKLSVRKFGVGVASLALVAGVGVSAQADVPVIGGATPTVDRIAGSDRVATAAAAAKEQYGATAAARTVYVVGYNAVVDAAVTGILDAPVIIMPATEGAQVLLGLQLNTDLPNARKLVAVGGTGVVSDEAMTALKKKWTNIATTARLDGKDRFETAIAINKERFPKGGAAPEEVLLTRSDNVVDALSAGAVDNAALLLVNPNGKVNEKVAEYYESLNKTAADVTVVGGTGALSDEQVKALVGGAAQIDPWKFITSEADARKVVQKAAAEYLGQYDWEGGTNTLAGYFAPGAAGRILGSAGTSVDASKTTTERATAIAANWFVGYKGYLAEWKTRKDKVDNIISENSRALNKSMTAASSVTAANLASKFDGGIDAGDASEDVLTAYRDLFGVYPTGTTANTALGAGNDTPSTFPGLKFEDNATNASKVKGWDKDSDFNKGLINTAYNAFDKKLSTTIESAIGTVHSGLTGDAPTGASTNTINWFAVQKLVNERYDEAVKLEAAADKALKDAVRAYNNVGTPKIVTTPGGISRIAGADRYETSALLSYYRDGGAVATVSATKVWLASGNDANMIDAVVAGQMLGGPVLIVPATGKLPASIGSELKRLGSKAAGAPAMKAIGGKAAISDELLVEANTSFKSAKATPTVAALPAVPGATASPSTVASTGGTAVVTVDRQADWEAAGWTLTLVEVTSATNYADPATSNITETLAGGVEVASGASSGTYNYRVKATKGADVLYSAMFTVTKSA